MAHVEQIYTGCLAQAAYFIRSEGEAVVIDPLRDPHPYLDMAAKHNTKIRFVIETHFHADFVSGHMDLAKAAGATIVYGPTAEPHFDAHIAAEGEVLHFGKASLTVLHTPGHTPESSCFVLRNDGDDVPVAIFTGDTLFIGDVGRPDLVQLVATTTQEAQAKILYRSLRDKIMPLPDSVIVYPGHGAGSACGKNMSSETTDLLGNQKRLNYALRADMTEQEFVEALLDGLRDPPQYFGHEVELNKGAAGSFDEIVAKGHRELTAQEVKDLIAQGVLAVDTRNSMTAFAESHIPGSVYAGTSGGLALWLASAVPNVTQPYVLCNEGPDFEEGLKRLTRVGYDNCLGYLKGGMSAWIAAGHAQAKVEFATPADVAEAIAHNADHVQLLDVRGPGEYRNAHLARSHNAPLCSRVPIDFKTLIESDKKAYIYCAAGYRAMMFISLCRRAGVESTVFNVTGGFTNMQQNPELKALIEHRAAH